MSAPVLTLTGQILSWTEVASAIEYIVRRQDGREWNVTGTTFTAPAGAASYAVQAVYPPSPEWSNTVTAAAPTHSVAFGAGHATFGGGWTQGPGHNYPFPCDVQLANPVQIAGGSDGTAFVMSDGSLYECGTNFSGTIGQGYIAVPMQPVYVPTRVKGGIPLYPAETWAKTFIPGAASSRPDGPIGPLIDGHVIAAAADATNIFALLDDGRVAAWGGNNFAILGNGYYGSTMEGIYGGANQVVEAIHKDEEEGHFYPQLAPGYVLVSGPPQQGTPLEGVKAVAVGHGVALYLLDNGDIWYTGWLGGAHTAPRAPEELYARPLPEPARAAVRGAIAITCQHQTCLALMPDGTVRAFGTNPQGQFGNGKVKSQEGSGTKVDSAQISGVVAIQGGEYHSVFLKADGTVWCCGRNILGECGQGEVSGPGAAFTTPVQVKGLSGVVAIAAQGEPEFGYTTIGSSYTLALLQDGTVAGWGGNGEGQLCDGTTEDKRAPVVATGLAEVSSIAAASNNGKAIVAGPVPAPSITAESVEHEGVRGALVKWSATGAFGWHVKSRHAQPEPLTAEQIAAGWYRVSQEKWQTTKLLPADTRECFVPLLPLAWEAADVPHYPATMLEITVAEALVNAAYPGEFQARTIEVDVG